jgi:hypothetical protein
MGLFGRSRREKAMPERLPGRRTEVAELSVSVSIETEQRIDVVGESHYQSAIRKACGWKRGTDTLFECMAELVPEPTNAYDPNAIMVKVDGRQVGYLSRADAAELGPWIVQSVQQQGTGMVRAVIAGHADGRTDNLGVFLHVDVIRS